MFSSVMVALCDCRADKDYLPAATNGAKRQPPTFEISNSGQSDETWTTFFTVPELIIVK